MPFQSSLKPTYIAKAKQLLQSGGLYLNNRKITQLDRTLEIDDFIDQRVAIMRAGKEEHLILDLQ
jgi:tyrosyl-tRNA synthetase